LDREIPCMGWDERSAALTALGVIIIDTQPFRAGLTFGGRPSGPWRRGRSDAALSSAAWQEIRIRSGWDDKGES